MLLYYTHTPTVIWSFLSHMRMALSYNTTKKLYNICNEIPLPICLHWPQHPTTAIITADNMSYFIYNNTPVNTFTGNVEESHTYNTINIWKKYFSTDIIKPFEGDDRVMLLDINEKNITTINNTLTINKNDLQHHIEIA